MPDSIHDLPLGDPSGRHARGGFEYQDHIGASYCLHMLAAGTLKEIWFESHDDITLIWRNGDGLSHCEFVQVKFVDRVWTLGGLTGRTNREPGTSILEKSLAQNIYAEPCSFRLVTSRDACRELRCLRFPIGSPERVAAQDELAAAHETITNTFSRADSPPTPEALEEWLTNCVWEEKESTLEGLEAINLLSMEPVMARLGIRLKPENRDRLYDLLMRKISKASHKRPFASRSVFKLTQAELQDWMRENARELVNGPNPADKLGSKLEEAGVPMADIDAARELKRMYNAERRDNDFCEPDDLKAMEAIILGKVNMLQRKQYNPATEETPLGFYNTCVTTAVEQLSRRRFVDENGEMLIDEWVAEGYLYEVVDRCQLRFRNQF